MVILKIEQMLNDRGGFPVATREDKAKGLVMTPKGR
jgi:hypothetical protein